ncbi:MAG: TolC family protein, partial [Burkholderiales bacterium]
QAEQALIAANANIGVAKAAFYPSISLTALLGTASDSLSNLFNGPARTWSYGAGVAQPIFTGGSLSSQLFITEAQREQALLQYQKAVQTAFQEVSDALIDQAKTREQLAAQARQVEALRNYARLARLRYDNGYTSYLEVTDAETKLFNTELQYTQVQGQLFFALINVYKAMGGGWVVEADKLAPRPSVDISRNPPIFP